MESENLKMDASFEPYEMFVAFLQAPTYHLALEAVLVLWVFWLLLHKSYKPHRNELTEREKDELIAEWSPEPLVPEESSQQPIKSRTISGKLGKFVTIDGKECLNAATHNYLGLVEHEKLEEAALRCLRKYGVGSCGPRGFYGTVDIHLELERRLASFLGEEEAALYSYGFSTIASAIPAYAKHGDIVFCDEGVNFAIQQGLSASRSEIRFFRHNDVTHLRELLEEQASQDKQNPKKARVTRRFLVVEGIYLNYGDICNLKSMISLKNEYKVRLFIDEGCSFGVLGDTGRGITEHLGIPRGEVDLSTGTLEAAIPGYGGFCVGTSFIVDHQRLSGLGYCFSASLPPLQAGVAIAALDILQAQPDLVQTLRTNCEYMHEKIAELGCLETRSSPLSPIQHLCLKEGVGMSRRQQTDALERIVQHALSSGCVALTVSQYLEREEHLPPPPSIRLIVNAALTPKDMQRIAQALQEATSTI